MKRILFIVVFVAIVLGIAVGIWYFLFGKNNNINDVQERPFVDESLFGEFFDTNNTGNNNFIIDPNDIDNDNVPDDIDTIIDIPVFRQISMEPVAGFTTFTRKREVEVPDNTLNKQIETEYVFRFIERATGHIFETTENNLTLQKISNKTIQKINNAHFFADPNKLVYQTLPNNKENISTFVAELIISPTSTEENVLDSESYSILAENIVTSPDQKEVAYLNIGLEGSTILTNNESFLKETVKLNIPLRELILDWPNQNFFTIQTKSSKNESGYFYRITNGVLTKLIGGVAGLTAKISPSGKHFLMSESAFNSVNTRVENTEEGVSRRITLSLLPEKCVFKNNTENIAICATPSRLPPANYPDDWYKGLITFNDLLWQIDLDTGVSDILFDFNNSKYGEFDAIDLSLTPDDKFLLIKNKKDLTLWSLDLERLNNVNDFLSDPSEPDEAL